MMKSFLFGSGNDSPSNSATRYQFIGSPNVSDFGTTESGRGIPMPMNCTVKNLYFALNAAPTAGKSYAFTVRKNSANTTLVSTISDSATSALDSTNTVSFTAGDLINISSVPSSTPTAPTYYWWDVEVNATAQPILGGNNNSLSNSVVNYSCLQGGNNNAWATTEADVQIICPTAGTFSSLYMKTTTAPGTGTSYAFMVMKNGATTTLTATVSDAATTANDTSNSFSVVAGDTLTIRSTPSGTPTATAAFWGLVFTPTVDGQSFFGFGNSASIAADNTTRFEQGMYAGSTSWSTTESTVYGYLGVQTLKNIYVKLGTAPAAGKTRTFTVRKAAASSSLAATISDAATTANATADVTFARDETFTIQSTATGLPSSATGGVHIGILTYNAPIASTRRIFFIS